MRLQDQLLLHGDITPEQLEQAMLAHKSSGKPLEDCIVSLGLCTEKEIFYAYSRARAAADTYTQNPFTLRDISGLTQRLKTSRVAWWIAFVFGILSGVFSTSIVFSGAVTSILDIALPAKDHEMLAAYLTFTACALLLGFLFYLLCWLSINLITTRFSRSLYVDLLSSIRTMPASMYHVERAGSTLSLVLSDVERLTSKVRIIASVVFQSTFGMALGVALLFSYDSALALVAIGLIVPAIWLPNKISTKSTPHSQAIPKQNALFFEKGGSYLKSRSFFQRNGFVDTLNDLFAQTYQKLLHHYFSSAGYQAAAHTVKWHLSTLLGITTLGLGSHFIETGTMTVGELVGFYFLVLMLMGSFNNISGLHGLIVSMKIYWGRIEQFLLDHAEDNTVSPPFQTDGLIDVELVDVSIVRSGGTVIDSCSLNIHRGEVVGIIGASGHGKSSLLQAMIGLVKTDHGNVYVGGNLIKNCEMNTPWADVRYIPQSHSAFYSMSIKDNITLFETEFVSDDAVDHILALLEIKDVIHALPGGIHAQGSAMKQLSTGQLQRLLLARLLTRTNRLVFIDEPTSNLDKESSIRVFNLLKKYAVTMVVVTHNEELLSSCDRVLCVEHATVKEVTKDFRCLASI